MRAFIVLLLMSISLSVCASNEQDRIKGRVDYISHEKGSLLKGKIIIQLYRDREGKELIAEKKLEKVPGKAGPFAFELSTSNLVKGAKWERPFFVRAFFDGHEPLKDNPEKGWLIKKWTFIIGPLKGGESNLILFFD